MDFFRMPYPDLYQEVVVPYPEVAVPYPEVVVPYPEVVQVPNHPEDPEVSRHVVQVRPDPKVVFYQIQAHMVS